MKIYVPIQADRDVMLFLEIKISKKYALPKATQNSMERATGLEPATSTLARWRSTR